MLLNPVVVQAAGALVIAAALLQAGFAAYGSWRRLAQSRRVERLSLDFLQYKVAAESARSQVEHERATQSWNGTRKFRVARKVQEGGDICSFYLVAHDGKALPPFQPGQYLTFQLQMPGHARPVTRCYSLSDSPLERSSYRVSIKRLPPPRNKPDAPPGLASGFFHANVNEGDILDVKAPNGHFFLDTSKTTPIVLIGGGVGLTPMLSMVNTVCAAGPKRETWFFYGLRNGREHVMKEHLERLARENENLHLEVCYSDPAEEDEVGRDYHRGERVSVDLFKRLLPSNNYEFYICGPPPMMTSITDGLGEWGVPKEHIHFEAFGPASVRKPKPKPAEAGPAIEVVFAKTGKKLPWNPAAGSLLDFAEENGIAIDSGCRAGNCGTCITAVRSGSVEYVNEPGSLPDDGTCLACIAVPKSDLTLEA